MTGKRGAAERNWGVQGDWGKEDRKGSSKTKLGLRALSRNWAGYVLMLILKKIKKKICLYICLNYCPVTKTITVKWSNSNEAMCVHVSTYMGVCMYVCIHMYIYVCIHIHVCVVYECLCCWLLGYSIECILAKDIWTLLHHSFGVIDFFVVVFKYLHWDSEEILSD